MKLYELFEFYKNENNKSTEFSVIDTNKQEFIISNSGDKNSYYLKVEDTETSDYYCLTDIFTSDELMEFEAIELSSENKTMRRDLGFSFKQTEIVLSILSSYKYSNIISCKYDNSIYDFYNDFVFRATKKEILEYMNEGIENESELFTEKDMFNSDYIYQIDKDLFIVISL